MTLMRDVYIGREGLNLDMAGRFRTSEKETLFTHSNISHINHVMNTKLVGAGTATHNYNTCSADLQVGTASGDKVTRESFYYIPYLPGSPILVKATGAMAASKTNVAQRLGIFNDQDGLFFEDDGTGMGIVRRTSTSGSPVNNRVSQSAWNIDKLDGQGPSGKTLTSWNRHLLYWIEYLWQGAVGARWGIVLDGEFLPLHEYFLEDVAESYMRTPSLPMRYEIENTGVSASATTLKEVCVDVVAEGGHRLVGNDWALDNDENEATVGTTEIPIFAIRLKDLFGGNPVRRMIKCLEIRVHTTVQDAHFRMAVVHKPTSITGGTWLDVDATHSAAEYNRGPLPLTITGGDRHNFMSFTAPATRSSSGQGFSESRFEDTHTVISKNIDGDISDALVVYARSKTLTTVVTVSVKILEFE